MTPEEIKFKIPQVQAQNKELNEVESKEILESIRLEGVTNIQEYQRETTIWRDKKVVRKDIQYGDLVLRRRPLEKVRKLQLKREGPFTVARSLARQRAFRLRDLEGND